MNAAAAFSPEPMAVPKPSQAGSLNQEVLPLASNRRIDESCEMPEVSENQLMSSFESRAVISSVVFGTGTSWIQAIEGSLQFP